MRQDTKTRLFIGGSILLIAGLLALVLFVDVLFPVRQEDVFGTSSPLGRERINASRTPEVINATAPVVIVEFSDFQCPFCRQTLPALKQAKAIYGDRVEVVYRHFPLASIHPLAMKAAEASECAADQGMFWPYHDLLFENQNAFRDEQLLSYAKRLGLDREMFSQCLASGIKRAVIQQDVQEGMTLGLQGTPTFFINDQRLDGAQPFSAFKEIIDEELKKHEKK